MFPKASSLLILCLLLSGFAATPLLAAGFSVDEWLDRSKAESGIDQLGRLYIEFLMEEDPAQSDQDESADRNPICPCGKAVLPACPPDCHDHPSIID